MGKQMKGGGETLLNLMVFIAIVVILGSLAGIGYVIYLSFKDPTKLTITPVGN